MAPFERGDELVFLVVRRVDEGYLVDILVNRRVLGLPCTVEATSRSLKTI